MRYKNEAMKSLISFILLTLVLTGCSLLQKNTEDTTLKTVSIHGTVHKPYCGGAKPNPDIAAGYYESMKYEKFSILKGTEFKEGMEIVKEIALDESGNVVVELEVGDYMFVRADKFLSLDEFMAANGPFEEENYKVKEPECFVTWKNTVDLYLKVEGDTTVEFREKAKCWVGTNPCLEYTGPPAP